MKKSTPILNTLDSEQEFDFQEVFFKYFFFWKYFVLSLVIAFCFSFFYLRYTTKIFKSQAKIKILNIDENSLELPSAEDFFSNSKINLENEIEMITSFSIMEQVVNNLNLTIEVEGVGAIMSHILLDYPFKVTYNSSKEISGKFELFLKDNGLVVIDDNGKEYLFSNFSTLEAKHDLPFEISNLFKQLWEHESYKLTISKTKQKTNELKEKINVKKVGNESDILTLNYDSSNPYYSQNVLNELMNVFNYDGVKDRQLVHKRTIDFVNERYIYLSKELDSIEIRKENYKIENKLVDLTSNSLMSLEKSGKSDERVFSNENQIFIVSNMLDVLNEIKFELLPSNIGIENNEINLLIQSYNDLILKQKDLVYSAGENNPSLKQLKNRIIDYKSNIISSLNNYLNQLNILNNQLLNQSNRVNEELVELPQQEKSLRSIARNQQIKESLYLFLLQKREEAQVSLAVTEPSIKVVEYASSSLENFYPNSNFVFLLSFLIGLLFPFLVLYFIFLFDNKLHSREDLEKFSLNVLAEIPFFDLPESEKVFINPDDRSIISESFRMLMSNVRYLQKNDSKSNVILVTSSTKGEGKTLNALNLALSFSSVGKKVLLIGCDLRNPQLHKYIDCEKNVPGLVNFLFDNTSDWKKNIIQSFDSQPLDILLSGALPPNPLNLINNGNLDVLLKDAKKIYDNIIIDSAPTLLVADTQSLINKSDVLIFLTRCNVTDIGVLNHIKKVSDEYDSNVGVILNGVGQKNSYGYSYGYRYGYGYNYKYSYNYGYGYGYNEES